MSYQRLIGLLAVLPSLLLMAAFGQSTKSDDDEFIRKHQYDIVKISCERIDDYAITRVFQNPVYHLTVSVKDGYGPNPSWGNLVATRVGDSLVPVPRPMRDLDDAGLLAMFRHDLKLSNGDIAETVQRALDLVFPAFSSDSKWTEKFLHDGDQWTFVRGRPNGSPVGPEEFVLTTDDKGTITAVRYVRNAPTP